MATREILLAQFEAFVRSSGMSERQFGLAAVNDGKFLPRLRSGFGVTLTTVERAEKFIADHARPAPKAAA